MASANPGTEEFPGQASSNRLALPLVLLLLVVAGLAGLVLWLAVESGRMRERPAIGASASLKAVMPMPGKPGKTLEQTKPRPDAEQDAEPEPAKPSDHEVVDPPAHHAAVPPIQPPAHPPAQAPAAQAPAERPHRSTRPLESLPPLIASRPPAAKPRKSSQPPGVQLRFKLPRLPSGSPLPAAPDLGLIQRTALGPLPIIGVDGRKPWQVYARPVDRADKRPRISIVIIALGLSSAATEAAIQGLPGPITLAFAPYSRRLSEWIRLARAAGHEVLLNLPLEPVNFPALDPGPRTLLTSLSEEENKERLMWTLSRGTGYVGVADFVGSKFTMSRKALIPVLLALNERGLLFLDSRSAPRSLAREVASDVGIPFVSSARFVDEWASRDAIDARLAELEQLAKARGVAVGMASPYPVSLERIAAWSAKLDAAGIALVPVSEIARRTAAR